MTAVARRVVACGFVVALAAAPTIARAQAPGQQPIAPAVDPTMADRWAVELVLGATSLKPQVDGATASSFGTGELSVRYRILPQLELAALIGGGGSNKDSLTMGTLFVEAHYRFLHDQPWNVYAIGGLGVASVSRTNPPSDTEKKGRGGLRIGAGVERRFGRFAIELELRLIAIAENAGVVSPALVSQQYDFERYGLGGASLVVGASYYF